MSENNNKLPNLFNDSSFFDLVKHMESFFNDSFHQFHSFFNKQLFEVDMYETNSDIVIEAPLPDYKQEQIQLEIVDQYLRISVNDSATLEAKHDNSPYQRKEQSFQRIERVIPLPFPISEKDTKATFEEGILKITIPKQHSHRKFIDID